MSVPMTFSDPEKQDVRYQVFPADLCNYSNTVLSRMNTSGSITRDGGACF